MQQQPDWFEYLKLTPDAPAGQVEQAVERLGRQAAALAVTAPERSQQLRDTVRAIKRDLLSGPENRARYDAARAAAAPAPAVPPPAQAPWPAAPQFQPPAQAGPLPPGAAPGPVPGGLEGLGSRVARFLRTGWTCSACGKEAMPSDKFCTKCGTAITPTRHDAARPSPRASCTNCNAPLGVNDAFCARCGTSAGK